MTSEIPGLFDSTNNSIGMTSPMATGRQDGNDRSVLDDLLAEKGSLGPNFVHSNKLLDQEIAKVKSGRKSDDGGSGPYYLMDPNTVLSDKVYIPLDLQKQHNLIGRLLGPKGITLKRIQGETQTKMSILGRGSMKDRVKEEQLRNGTDLLYAHLKDDLHVYIEAVPPFSNMKLAAGVSEIKKMIIPPIPGQPDPLLARYLDPQMAAGFPQQGGPPHPAAGPSPRGRGRGGPPRGGYGGRGGPMTGGRGGGFRGRGGGGRGAYESPRGGRGARGGMRGRGAGAGGPMSAPPYEQPSYADRPSSGGGWQDSVSEISRLPPDTYTKESRDVGYDDRWKGERRSGGDYGRSSDYYSLPSDSDPYYSSFSDTPTRGSQYERDSMPSRTDYNHSSSSSDWKASRPRRESRHHPYNSGGSSYF